jgi:predicted nucleic acid-binding protein
MDLVVVDTDVLSFIFKHDSQGAAYKPHLAGKEIIISFMTLAELNHWAIRSNWGTARKQKLDAYRKPFTVFHSDEDLCLKWAHVMEDARRNGRPIQTADAWVAATALLHDIPIVTNNRKHFVGVDGLTVISEDNP